LSDIGTDSLSKHEFGKALQQLGTTFETSAEKNSFSITLSGIDSNLSPSLQLLRHFMDHAKADKESMKTLASSYQVNDRSFFKSADDVADAITEKIAFGDKSSYINHLSTSDLKKMKAVGSSKGLDSSSKCNTPAEVECCDGKNLQPSES
jgi:hypothetical protein